MNRYRILLILPSFDSGGAENYALRLINFAGHERYEWHVTSGNLQNAQLRPAFLAAGAHVHSQTTGYFNPKKATRFFRFLKKYNFDVVVSFNSVYSAPAMLISWTLGIPRRVTWHRCWKPATPKSLLKAIYQIAAIKIIEVCSNKILSNSKAALSLFHSQHLHKENQFQIIPNGLDPALFPEIDEGAKARLREKLGIPNDAIVIGHVGRFVPDKDHKTLLKVVRNIVQKNNKVRLLAAGSGTESAEFAELVINYSLEDVTTRVGSVDNINELYQIMDLFIFPSITESQANALIEAMICSVPIVVSDIPPNRETIPRVLEQNLFEPGDFVGATKIAIRLLSERSVESRHLTKLWAEKKYDASRNFSAAINAMIDK